MHAHTHLVFKLRVIYVVLASIYVSISVPTLSFGLCTYEYIDTDIYIYIM